MPSRRDHILNWMKQAGVRKIRDSGHAHLVGTCPFHGDSNPSFSINTENGLFVCYSGGCGVSGNLINFLMSQLRWSFDKSRMASKLVDIPTLDDIDVENLPPYERRHCKELEVEDRPFREGHLGMYKFIPRYMLDRGYEKRLLQEWEVGYDYGTKRVTIPVRSAKGELVGVTKRSTLEEQLPKYLHLGFKKGNHLYGAHRGGTDRVVVVEGQVDVIAWYALIRRFDLPVELCVSTMGSRVSSAQVLLLSKYKQVILAFDNDEDGYAAMRRVGEALMAKKRPSNLLVLRTWPEECKDVGDIYERHVKRNAVMKWLNLREPYIDME